MDIELKELIGFREINKNETVIQCELYHQCKLKNIEIYLEPPIKNYGRPDAILIINNKPIIIECKYLPNKMYNIYSRQMMKYSRAQLPIVVLQDFDHIKIMLDFLFKNELEKGIYMINLSSRIMIHYAITEFNEENYLNFDKKIKMDKLNREYPQ